jgi:hypothetical protein
MSTPRPQNNEAIKTMVHRKRAGGAVTILLLALVPAACAQSDTAPEAQQAPAQTGSAGPIDPGAQMPADHPPIDGSMGGAPAQAPADAPVGTVKETMNSAGYTYALLDIDGDEIWSAGPVTALEVGDQVAIANPMGMNNFTASSLDRTFEQILFVSAFTKQ